MHILSIEIKTNGKQSYVITCTGDEQLLSRDRKSQRRLQKQIVILYIKVSFVVFSYNQNFSF